MNQQRLTADPWWAVCPDGHNSWENTVDGSYLCQQCGQFKELHDAAEIERPAAPMRR